MLLGACQHGMPSGLPTIEAFMQSLPNRPTAARVRVGNIQKTKHEPGLNICFSSDGRGHHF